MDLKTYLFKNGIKQSELARACGISPTIICDLVHKRQHFSWELCDIVSKATGGAVKAEDMVAGSIRNVQHVEDCGGRNEA